MIPAQIPISPFQYPHLGRPAREVEEEAAEAMLQCHLGRPFALTPSGREALALALDDAALGREDTVTILTSTGNSYVSGCVTRTIERVCHWSMKIEPSTRLIVVIHDFGIPYPKIDEVLKSGVPVLEDCAYAFASSREGRRVGRDGKYAIFSLPKFFPINYGGLVCGIKRRPGLLPEHRETILNVVGSELPRLGAICGARLKSWHYLEMRFGEFGCPPALTLEAGTIPGVFMFQPAPDVTPENIKRAYQKHGVEASVFYPRHAVFVPCHQSLTPAAMDYIVEVYVEAARSEA